MLLRLHTNRYIPLMITILLEIALVFEQSKDYLVKFIERSNKVSKQAVIAFMESDKVPAKFRTSRVTTLKVIRELETDRIKVIKEGWRRGQAQYLIINDKSHYRKISENLSALIDTVRKNEINRYKLPLKRKGGRPGELDHLSGIDGILLNLLLSLIDINTKIHSGSDIRVLQSKVIDILVMVAGKKMEELRIVTPFTM